MSSIDTRRPAEVTAAFRERLAHELAPLGFLPRNKGAALVRRSRASGTHRIELGSSHRNVSGHVACWITLSIVDKDIEALEPGWRAGGGLSLEPFAVEVEDDIADPRQADGLVALVRSHLSFFDLLDDPPRALQEVRRRYVPGFFRPRIVVPYLRSRLGVDAVKDYATSLLTGRPELWPAFSGSRGATSPPKSRSQPDQGTELALMLARHANDFDLAAPTDAARSTDLAAANLRCFFGRQLRAWGEPEAAALLRRFDDARIQALRAEQERIPPNVDSREQVQIVLDAILGEHRAPRRNQPKPRLFQYFVLHEPFAFDFA